MTLFQQELLAGWGAPSASGAFSRLAPLPKVCLVLGFLILTVSFGRRAWCGCTLFAVVPYLLARAGGVSPVVLLRRASLALPFDAMADNNRRKPAAPIQRVNVVLKRTRCHIDSLCVSPGLVFSDFCFVAQEPKVPGLCFGWPLLTHRFFERLSTRKHQQT